MRALFQVLQSVWPLMAIVYVGAFSVSACNPHDDEGVYDSVGSECVSLSWSAFYADPLAYDRQMVCLDGQVITAFATIRFYPTDADYFWEAPAYLSLNANEEILRESGVGPGDLVRLTGTLSVEEVCPPSVFAPITDDGCDNPLIDVAQFTDLSVSILEPARADAVCRKVDMADFLVDPVTYNHRIICTEGLAELQGEEGILVPSGASLSPELAEYVSTFFDSRLGRRPYPQEGEQIRATGLVEVDEQCLAEPAENWSDYCGYPMMLHVYQWTSQSE